MFDQTKKAVKFHNIQIYVNKNINFDFMEYALKPLSIFFQNHLHFGYNLVKP